MLVNLILILVLLAFAAGGWRSGFVQTLGHFIGAILGFLVARAWYSFIGSILLHVLPVRPGIASFIAFVLIFIAVERIVGILTAIADKVLKILTHLPFLNTIQRLLGAFLGFLEGIVFIGSSAYVILQFRIDPTLVAWVTGSSVAQACSQMFSRVLGALL